MCAVGAINAAQDPAAVPFFARTRQSPLTLAAAPCVRLRERVSILCLCNTDHPAGSRIRKQDPWELEGHGQYVPPRLPPPQASISYAADGISYAAILDTTSQRYIVCFWRCEPTTSEPYVRYRIIPMLHCTSYATSSKNVQCHIRCRTYDWQEQAKNVRYRTFFGDIVRCTYDVVKKTYDVVYDIVYDIVRQNGKNLYFEVRYRTSDIRYRIRYRIRYIHE